MSEPLEKNLLYLWMEPVTLVHLANYDVCNRPCLGCGCKKVKAPAFHVSNPMNFIDNMSKAPTTFLLCGESCIEPFLLRRKTTSIIANAAAQDVDDTCAGCHRRFNKSETGFRVSNGEYAHYGCLDNAEKNVKAEALLTATAAKARADEEGAGFPEGSIYSRWMDAPVTTVSKPAASSAAQASAPKECHYCRHMKDHQDEPHAQYKHLCYCSELN